MIKRRLVRLGVVRDDKKNSAFGGERERENSGRREGKAVAGYSFSHPLVGVFIAQGGSVCLLYIDRVRLNHQTLKTL